MERMKSLSRVLEDKSIRHAVAEARARQRDNHKHGENKFDTSYPGDMKTRLGIRAWLRQNGTEWNNAGGYSGATALAICHRKYSITGMLLHFPSGYQNLATRVYVFWYGQSLEELKDTIAELAMTTDRRPFVLMCTKDFVDKHNLGPWIKFAKAQGYKDHETQDVGDEARDTPE